MTKKDRQTVVERLDALEIMFAECLKRGRECSQCPVRYICKEVYGNNLIQAAAEIGKQAEQQIEDHAEELRAKHRKRREVTKVLTVQITSVRRLPLNVILSKANRDDEKMRQEELARKIKDIFGFDDVTVLTKQVFYKDE